MSKATCDFASPNTDPENSIDYWEPSVRDLKTYSHFDAVLPIDKIKKLVRDPKAVSRHSFRPLLQFEKRWRRAPKNGKARPPKVRPISYACRKDAYIYKHYRDLLSRRYERKLAAANLGDVVLAYRRIPSGKTGRSNKSNIHFARDAFDAINSAGKCCAVAIDISDYFGSINHEKLKGCWAELIGQSRLPPDHYAVFRSVTQYRYANLDEVLLALGYSEIDNSGAKRFSIRPKEIPIQLCTPENYRTHIVDRGLVRKHSKRSGIPQGTPISDLLSNLFLFEFDRKMRDYAKNRNGYYFRYSDDILIILPGDGRAGSGALRTVCREIRLAGEELQIKPEKTDIVCFLGRSGSRRCYSIGHSRDQTRRGRNSPNEGLSYLGFRYDGKRVYLRNSTITNLRGKIARACKAAAFRHVRRHQEKNLVWLLANRPSNQLKQEFMNVEDFDEVVSESLLSGETPFKHMTFWSYVKRARKVFGERGGHMMKQLAGIEDTIETTFKKEIQKKYKNAKRKKHRTTAFR